MYLINHICVRSRKILKDFLALLSFNFKLTNKERKNITFVAEVGRGIYFYTNKAFYDTYTVSWIFI